MSNNLPQKYNNNIFHRFFCYIKNRFFNKHSKLEQNTKDEKYEENIRTSDEFLKEIKLEKDIRNTEYEKRNFMDNLKKSPELLENFSSERLEKILQYYLEENEKKKLILKKLNG